MTQPTIEEVIAVAKECGATLTTMNGIRFEPEELQLLVAKFKQEGRDKATKDAAYYNNKLTEVTRRHCDEIDRNKHLKDKLERAGELVAKLRAQLEEAEKQEPVAYTNKEQLGYLNDERYAVMPMAMWANKMPGCELPLYTHPLPAPAVPGGWQLVPKSIWQTMIDAALLCDGDSISNKWDAMLAAAPQPKEPT